MRFNGVIGSFHHMGIPTDEKRPGERYSRDFGMYTSDSDCKSLRIQWHRFEPDSPLHPLIRTVPHVAFKVDDLERTINGCRILLGPFEPIAEYRVAIIEDGGQPIEFVQTILTDEELWERAEVDGITSQTVRAAR